MIVIGIIIFLIFFLGLKTKKNHILLVIYLIYVTIIFLFYSGLFLMLKVFTQTLIDYIKTKITNFKEEELKKIKQYNTNLFIITCIGAFCTLLAFIGGIFYYKKLKGRNKEINLEKELGEDDVSKGNDYGVLPADTNK